MSHLGSPECPPRTPSTGRLWAPPRAPSAWMMGWCPLGCATGRLGKQLSVSRGGCRRDVPERCPLFLSRPLTRNSPAALTTHRGLEEFRQAPFIHSFPPSPLLQSLLHTLGGPRGGPVSPALSLGHCESGRRRRWLSNTQWAGPGPLPWLPSGLSLTLWALRSAWPRGSQVAAVPAAPTRGRQTLARAVGRRGAAPVPSWGSSSGLVPCPGRKTGSHENPKEHPIPPPALCTAPG